MVACRECYLLSIAGWRESVGVEMECKLAAELHLSITGYSLGEDDEQVSGLDIRRQFGLPILRAKQMKVVK